MKLIEASTSTQEEKPVSSKDENTSNEKIDKSEAQVKDRAKEILQDGSFNLLRQNGTWDVYKYYMQQAGPYVSAAFFGVLAIQAFAAQYASELSCTTFNTLPLFN
jgi:mRNA deadenylase 3'-5' endonuclease subunit Ccr4